MPNENKSVEEVLKASKDMSFLQNIMSYVKDIRSHTQDSALEEMLQNENSEKLTDSISSMKQDMNKGFKDLSFSRDTGKKELASPMTFDAEYINLSDKTLQKMASLNDEYEMEHFYPPMLSNAERLLSVNTEIRDLLVKQNVYDSNLVNLDSPQVYQEKTTYYLKTLSDGVSDIHALMVTKGIEKGESKSAFGIKSPKDEGDKGLFDSALGLFGLKPIWEGLKKAFMSVSGLIDKAFAPIGSILSKGFSWIGSKVSAVLGPIIDKALSSNVVQKLMSSKAFGTVVSGVTKVLEFLGPIGAMGSKLLKVIPGVGQIITIATSLWAFTDGLKHADEIVGKAKDKLSTVEKVGAGVAGILSDLTFGFVNAKTMYKGLKFAGNMISETFDLIKGVFPKQVRDSVGKISDGLFNKEKGIFGSVIKGFDKVIDTLMNDGMWAGIKESLFQSLNALVDVPKKIFTMIGDSITNLIGQENIFKGFDIAKDVMGKISDFVLDLVKAYFKSMTFGAIGDKEIDKGIDFTKKIAGGAVDSVKGFFGMETSDQEAIISPKNIAAANAVSIPKDIGASQTTQLTQENAQKVNNIVVPPAQQTIVVQAPEQPRSITRKSKAGTDTVLTLNSASGRP